jgi:hypothetical protein
MRGKWTPKVTRSQVRVFIKPARFSNLAKNAANTSTLCQADRNLKDENLLVAYFPRPLASITIV